MKIKFTMLSILICLRAFAQTPDICYPFDGNTNDFSGNNVTGQANLINYSSDRFGNSNSAILLNGNGSVRFNSQNVQFNEFTWSLWFKLYQYPGGSENYTLLSIGGSTSDQVLNVTNASYTGQNQLMFTSYDDDGIWTRSYSDFLPALNIWYNVVVTRSNQQMEIYVNGTLDAVTQIQLTDSAGYIGTTSNQGFIGARIYATFENFVGEIDDVRIYNGIYKPNAVNGVSCLSGNSIDDMSFSSNKVFYNSSIREISLPKGFDSFQLIDMQGQIIAQNTFETKMDVSGISNGIYLINGLGPDNKVYKTKLLVY